MISCEDICLLSQVNEPLRGILSHEDINVQPPTSLHKSGPIARQKYWHPVQIC